MKPWEKPLHWAGRFCLFLCLWALAFGSNSCTQVSRVVMKEYAGKRIDGARLTVVPFRTITIRNKDDVTDDLGIGDPDSVFKAVFEPAFAESMKRRSLFGQVSFDEIADPLDLHHRSLKTNIRDEEIALTFPQNETVLEFEGEKPDYVLFLESLEVNRKSEFKMGQVPMAGGGFMPTTQSRVYLSLTASYVIWDNKKGRIISYGRPEVKSDILFAMTDNTWTKGIELLAVAMVEETPFEKPYYSQSAMQ